MNSVHPFFDFRLQTPNSQGDGTETMATRFVLHSNTVSTPLVLPLFSRHVLISLAFHEFQYPSASPKIVHVTYVSYVSYTKNNSDPLLALARAPGPISSDHERLLTHFNATENSSELARIRTVTWTALHCWSLSSQYQRHESHEVHVCSHIIFRRMHKSNDPTKLYVLGG